MTTNEIIKILEEIALLLELKGENPFKARSYLMAARNLEVLDEDLSDLVEQGRLDSIKGVGEALSKKIEELVRTGRLEYYEKLKASIPPGHFEMLKIPGLGPKKIKALYDHLAIETVGELEYACNENRLTELPGFGQKTQDKILEGIRHMRRYQERRLYSEVIGEAEALLKLLEGREDVREVRLGGSLRRGYETVKDIDLLAASNTPDTLGDYFAALPVVESIIAKGETKVSVVLKIGSQLRFAYRFTGRISLCPASFHGKPGTQHGHAGPGQTPGSENERIRPLPGRRKRGLFQRRGYFPGFRLGVYSPGVAGEYGGDRGRGAGRTPHAH